MNYTTQSNFDSSTLKVIFVNLFGTEFKSQFNLPQIRQLLEIYKRFDDNIVVDPLKRQLHTLYLIAHSLHEYNEEYLKLEPTDFYNDFYFPNMVSIISIHMKEARSLLKSTVRVVYNEVKDKCKDVIDFYLVLYNSEPAVIKNDLLNLFLNTLFLDTDPLYIEDIRSHYRINFRYLLYSYLKNKTTRLSSFEIEPSVLKKEDVLSISTRLRIYEDGIKITRIQELCDKSNTYTRILQNYNKLKKEIISNELQKIHLYTLNKTTTTDDKVSILSTFENDDKLELIREKLPLIYKLLRSLHITSQNTIFDESFKKLMYNSIYEVLFLEFSKNLSTEISANLAMNIAKKITYSLSHGQFVDPITMDSLSINNYIFLNQLKIFLEMTVKNVNK